MRKSNKWLLIILGVLLVGFIGIFIFYILTKDDNRTKVEINVLDEIKDYGYSLTSLDSEYYKSLFGELKDILDKEEVDKEAYAKAVAKLFITDLYTIDTKTNKYDVGGDIYYHSDPKKNAEFKQKIIDKFYDLLEDNSYGDRKQELPRVNNIEVTNYTTGTYKLYEGKENEQEVNSYIVELKWSFEKDLGYNTTGVVTLVDNGKKIEVVEYTIK